MRRLLPLVVLAACYPSDPDYVTGGDDTGTGENTEAADAAPSPDPTLEELTT
mgnify:CR=1 FL=1